MRYRLKPDWNGPQLSKRCPEKPACMPIAMQADEHVSECASLLVYQGMEASHGAGKIAEIGH